MSNPRSSRFATLLALAIFAGGCSSRNDRSGGEDLASVDGGGGGGPDASLPGCSAHDPCVGNGASCFNGQCIAACASDTDCTADQYCATGMTGDYLCHAKSAQTCATMSCGAKQICVNGYCSTPPPGFPCGNPSPFNPVDGCGQVAVCLLGAVVNGKTTTDKQCYTFDLCPMDGNCPISSVGAVCNDGIFPEKARICLPSLCKTTANCPANWQCVYSNDRSVLHGVCTDGKPGSGCGKAADCISSTCMQPYPGAFGTCN